MNREPVGAKARIFASTSFLTLGVVVNALIGILIARTLARHLGVAGYGQYALAHRFIDMALLGALAGGAMVVLAPDLIFHLISPRFTDAVGILRILAVAAFLIYLNSAFAHATVAVGIQGPGFLSTRTSAAGFNVGLNLL